MSEFYNDSTPPLHLYSCHEWQSSQCVSLREPPAWLLSALTADPPRREEGGRRGGETFLGRIPLSYELLFDSLPGVGMLINDHSQDRMALFPLVSKFWCALYSKFINIPLDGCSPRAITRPALVYTSYCCSHDSYGFMFHLIFPYFSRHILCLTS